MKKLLPFLVFTTIIIQVQCQNLPPQVFDRQVLKENLVAADSFKPIPQAKDFFWRQVVPQETSNDYIRYGHSYKGAKWDIIPDLVFGEYRANGNRANYESLSFGKRRQMACLVLAEIMEHKGTLMGDIINGLEYFMQEKWWGVSAHYPQAKPDSKLQVVDLFNSETANLLAWTIYMLHDELEECRPGICDTIKKEIDRRLLEPARKDKSPWKNNLGNHNTWTCENWLSCILLCETDRGQQLEDIEQILTSLEYFYNGYPEDGGCDEGVHYWDRAAASLYECVRLLELATNGKLSLANNAKFKAMGSYVYKSYICDNGSVNFADTPSNTKVAINVLFPFGQYIGDSTMMGYAAFIAKERSFKQKPYTLFLNSGNFASISRELLFLSKYKDFEAVKPEEPLIRDTWLPDLQVFTARSKANLTNGLYLAAKGGHNAENHNHNDVGSFIAYYGTTPIIIDLGFATYTSKTFGDMRYELMNNRSGYHNVPIINGFEQHEGKKYCANNVNYKQNDKYASLSLDLEEAYPKDASINRWHRNIRLNRGKSIVITEDYELKRIIGKTEIVLICHGEPVLDKEGRIEVVTEQESHYIIYNAKQLLPIVEKLPTEDFGAWLNKPIYRIRLIVNNDKLKGKIKYTIQYTYEHET